MGAIKKLKPEFFGSSIETCSDNESTVAIGTAKGTEATMATVMMTQLHDTKLQTRFNRLILMDQNDQPSNNYPLNQNVTYVGRSRSNHVKISDPLVSTRHLSVTVSGNTCVVNDLDSSNGTFINGDRLVGARVLSNGDEILVGKTVLRFATRQMDAPVSPGKAPKAPVKPSDKKGPSKLVKTLLCLGITAVLAFTGIYMTSKLFSTQKPLLAVQAQDSSAQTNPKNAKTTPPQGGANKGIDSAQQQTPPKQTSHIRRALDDYTAGRLYNAKQTLMMLTTARELTPEARTAKIILSKVDIVQQQHAHALLAQSQKKYARALECWDRILIVDADLVGDRPSFFSRQAEQRVQSLSYAYALDAFQTKKLKKAGQLCQVILKINPKHADALALLSKIDPKV